MKTSYNRLLIFLAAGTSLPAVAQTKDSTLVREMTIEKEYNPIVRDADKITRMPEVEAPQANRTKVEYANPTLNGTSRQELQVLEVGDVNTGYPFSHKRGYLNLAGGNYLNLQGDLGFRFIDTNKDVFGVEYKHASSKGDVKFVEESWGKSKRKVNDNFANLYYHHRFNNLLLKTNVSYDYEAFNFYGKNRSELDSVIARYPENAIRPDYLPFVDQTLQRVDLNFGLHTLHKGEWDYKMNFGFTAFSQDFPDIKEKTISVLLGLAKQTGDKWAFGMDLDTRFLVYSGESVKNDWTTEFAYKNMGTVSIRPQMKYDNGSNLKADLGVRVDLAMGRSPYVGVAPDVRLNWEMAEHWLLYADLTGGIAQYSLNDLTRENRYYCSYYQNKNSYNIADLKFGIRSNVLSGFWFDIYAQAGYTLNERFEQSRILQMNYLLEEQEGLQAGTEGFPAGTPLVDRIQWNNVVSAYTADAFSWTVGLKMKYQFSNKLKLNFKFEKNGWNVKDGAIASYKPGYEVDFGIRFKPVRKLDLDLNYQMLGDRKASVVETSLFKPIDLDNTDTRIQTYKLKDINTLNLKANYAFNDMFNVNASLNNLLGRRQDVYYGMPELGFHFLIGAGLRF
ncbi:MAG: hypothetical protein ACRCSQ_06820 [Bacteroidales bacterium]